MSALSRYRQWSLNYRQRMHDKATPMERAAAYSGYRATFRLMWHRWTGKVPRDW